MCSHDLHQQCGTCFVTPAFWEGEHVASLQQNPQGLVSTETVFLAHCHNSMLEELCKSWVTPKGDGFWRLVPGFF